MRFNPSLMQNIAIQLLRNLNSELALQRFVQQVNEVFGSDNATLLLADEDAPDQMILCAAAGVEADRVGNRVDATRGAVAACLRSGEILVVDDYRTWPERLEDSLLSDIATLLTAPLRSGGKFIGVLQLSWNGRVYSLSPEEVGLFSQFSLLASVAVDSSLMFEKVRREKAMTEAIFDTLPGMVFQVDTEGRLLRWNRKVQELTGFSPEELRQMKGWDFMPDVDREAVRQRIAAILQDGSFSTETGLRRQDGSVFRAFLTAAPLTFQGRTQVIGIGLDITERVRAEEALQHSEEKFRNVVEASPLGMHLYVLDAAGQLRLDMANPQADTLLGVAHAQLLGQSIEEAFPNLAGTEVPALYRAVARGEAAGQSFEIDYRDNRVAGYYYVTVFRIARNAMAATFMDITRRRKMEEELRQHRDRLEQLVESRTEELSAANEELTALNEELAAVNDEVQHANRQLLAEIDLREHKERELVVREQQYRAATHLLTRPARETDMHLEAILRDALQLVKAPAGYIALYNEAENKLLVRQTAGPAISPQPTPRGLLARVVERRQSEYVEDYRQYPFRVDDPRLDRLTSMIAIPLQQGSRLIGILVAHWLDEACPVNAETVEVLRQYGDLAAAVLERDATQARILRQNELLVGLADTTSALLGDLDLNSVLLVVLEKAITLTGIPHGFVHLFEDDVRHGYIRAGKGRYQARVGMSADISGGVLAEVIRTGRMVVVPDYANWPARLATPQQEGVTAAMQAPLKIGDKLIGVIGLSVFGESVSFEPEMLEGVEQLADIASIAVKTAVNREETRKLAYDDPLTGMANRSSLKVWLEAEMNRVRAGLSRGTLFFIDLDDLKTVNDTFGHAFGDEVIVTAGSHIRRAVDPGSFIARVGGDEFVVAWPGQSDRTEIGLLADRLVKALSQEYGVSGQRVHLSASVGVALYPEDGQTAGDILKNADSAMYVAKRSGRNCWAFYEKAQQTETYEKMVLTNSLRRAMDRNELKLHFQPKVRLQDRRITGFEALLRWNSEEHGSVPPVRFIPFAEHSGVIVPIGRWVMQEACRFAKQLADRGRGELRVAVNISPRQLADPDFIAMVRDTVRQHGVQPGQIEIEVTETVLIEAMEDSILKLGSIRRNGIHIALDDFGTGYSSLTYLRRLPVDTLKVDKSFIDGILSDEIQADLVCSIIAMAHTLNLNVVAEGVETEEQLQKLRQCGCDCIQGYVFSRPVSDVQALDMLR